MANRVRITPKQLTQRVVDGIEYEELKALLHPLMVSYSRQYIDGLDREDTYQELCIDLWTCQRRFDPTRGTTFMTPLIRSFQNRMGKLRTQAKKRKPIQHLECANEDCDSVMRTRGRGGVCLSCGGKRWNSIRDRNMLRSLDVVDGLYDIEDPELSALESIANHEEVQEYLLSASPEQLEVALKMLLDENVTSKERRILSDSRV